MVRVKPAHLALLVLLMLLMTQAAMVADIPPLPPCRWLPVSPPVQPWLQLSSVAPLHTWLFVHVPRDQRMQCHRGWRAVAEAPLVLMPVPPP